MSGVCRYWQSGTCRAGDSCRFEHPGRNSNVFATNRFGAAGGSSSGGGATGVDLESQIMTTVRQDMECVEKSGQWIFSCYSPAKDCASLPGLDDVSPEELRSEAYAAKHVQGGEQQYQSKIQSMVQDYANKRNAMKNPDINMKKTLVKIYNKESLDGGGVFGSTSGSFGSSGVSAGQSQSLFGGAQSSSTSAFGSQATGSVFGGSVGPTASSSAGIFGGSTTAPGSSLFGKPSTFGGNTSSIFGSQTSATAAPPSVFGGSAAGSTPAFGQPATFGQVAASQSQQAPGSSLFGGGVASVFGQQPSGSTSAFGTAPAPGTTSVFGQSSTSASVFGGGNATTPQSTSFFSQQPANQPSSIFAPSTTQASTSVFGNAAGQSSTSQPPAITQTNSAFGVAQPTTAFASTSSPFSATSPFSSNTTGQSLFGQSAAAGNAAPGQGIFAQPGAVGPDCNPVPSGAPGQGIFSKSSTGSFGASDLSTPSEILGASSGGTGGLFGKPQVQEKELDPACIYTALDQLTEEEKNAFQSCDFTLGKIPIRPPPKEFCA